MSETNYNETIIIPFLQKKCQDLLNTNLVFEANLSVEQAKSKDSSTYFNSQIEELKRKISVVTDEKNDIQSQNNIQLQNKIDELKKINAEQHNLISVDNNHKIELQNNIDELKRVSIEQSNLISVDRQKITDQTLEIEELKRVSISLSDKEVIKSKSTTYKTKKEVKLGGETY